MEVFTTEIGAFGKCDMANINNIVPVIKSYVMTARGELKVQNHAFLHSALDPGECTILSPGPFIREERFHGRQ